MSLGSPIRKEMTKQVYGNVPQELIDEMASAPKRRALEKGIEIAGSMIKQVSDFI